MLESAWRRNSDHWNIPDKGSQVGQPGVTVHDVKIRRYWIWRLGISFGTLSLPCRDGPFSGKAAAEACSLSSPNIKNQLKRVSAFPS